MFLGDIVGYGASPAKCVDRVRQLGGEWVIGNHDMAIKRVRMRGRQGMYDRMRAARDIVNAGLPFESVRRLFSSDESALL